MSYTGQGKCRGQKREDLGDTMKAVWHQEHRPALVPLDLAEKKVWGGRE